MISNLKKYFFLLLLSGAACASIDMPPTFDDMPDDQKSAEATKEALGSKMQDYNAQISDLSRREAALAAQIRSDEDTRQFIETNNEKIRQTQASLDDPDKASHANKEIAELQRRNNALAQNLTLTPEDRAGVQAQMEDLRGQRDVLAAERANTQAKIEGRDLPYPTLEQDRAPMPVQEAVPSARSNVTLDDDRALVGPDKEVTPPARPARRAPPLPPTRDVSIAPETKAPPQLPPRRPSSTTYQRGPAPALPPRQVPALPSRVSAEASLVDDSSNEPEKTIDAERTPTDPAELKNVQSELKLQRGLAASGFGDPRVVQQLEAREAELRSGQILAEKVSPVADSVVKKPGVYRRFINTVTGRTAAQKAIAPGGEVYAINQRRQAQQEAQRQLIAEQSQDQKNISSISQKLQDQQERIARLENQRDFTQTAAERTDLDARRTAALADRDVLVEQQKSARNAYVKKWTAPQKALALEPAPAPVKKPGFFSRFRGR